MEPQGSSPFPQQPASCLYSDPDKRRSRPSTLLLYDSLKYYPPIYAQVFKWS